MTVDAQAQLAASAPAIVLGLRMMRLTAELYDLIERPIELIGWRTVHRHCRLMMRGAGVWMWSIALLLVVMSGGAAGWWAPAVIGTALAVWPDLWMPALAERREPWEPIVDLRDPASVARFLDQDDA